MGWMGPVVDGQAHEGWVAPLFADGAQGAGATSARGVLVARRPGEGPRDGDRVRLTGRDGCTVEGIWCQGSLLGEAGIVPADPGGPARSEVLEVVEEVEEWRPDAEVVGWVAGCTCGWRGLPWARVSAWEAADPAARQLYVPGPEADLDAAAEARVRQEWRRHIARWQALEEVELAAARHAAADRELDEAVYAAVTAGASWAEVGRATGMTGAAATGRWSGRG